MYNPKLPITGAGVIAILGIGLSNTYRALAILLLTLTLSIIIFRLTRLLFKEKHFIRLLIAIIAFILIGLGITYQQGIKEIKKQSTPIERMESGNSTTASAVTVQKKASLNIHAPSGVVGKLTVPKINLKLNIIAECTEENLYTGACHIEGTPYFTQPGNCFLASHNVKNYGVLFNRLNELKNGDIVEITSSDITYVYHVYATEKVLSTDTKCFEKIKGSYNVTLVTCTSDGEERLVVYCKR